MKKLFLLFGIVLIVIVLVGADLRQQKDAMPATADQKPCYGYTIIEFGKAVNCYGDTVRLTKVRGGGQKRDVMAAQTATQAPVASRWHSQ